MVRRGQIPVGNSRPSSGTPRGSFVGCAGWRADRPPAEARRNGEQPPLLHPPPAPDVEAADPAGWHATGPPEPLQGRRRRRIDAWYEGNETVVDAFFRDSNVEPDGAEVVVHEYVVEARLNTEDGTIVQIRSDPRVLPFEECPYASAHVGVLIGRSIHEVAFEIHRELRGETSCTHLNDTIRLLAAMPSLAGRALDQRA